MTSFIKSDVVEVIRWAQAREAVASEAIAELRSFVLELTQIGDEAGSYSHMSAAARQLWSEWYSTTVDTPCIAICSTSQGDDECRGCGRTFEEVTSWVGMGPEAKRASWRRISLEGRALRFRGYSERANR